jgi:hypothetical protein
MKGFLEMDDYNFVPDYATWWDKEDLTKEQLCWLALGVNPEEIKKLGKPDLQDNQYSKNYVKWSAAFLNYLDTTPCGFSTQYLYDNHKNIYEYVEMGLNKESFIENLYDYNHKFPKSFSDFLSQIKPSP